MSDAERKKQLPVTAFLKSSGVQTLHPLSHPVAPADRGVTSLGSANTRPRWMGSVDTFPWLLAPCQEPRRSRKEQPVKPAEETY